MAHMIDMTNDRANIAFVGEMPWHGLGHQLPEDADLETWRTVAGLNWDLVSAKALYMDPDRGVMGNVPDRNVLLRSDTRQPLAVVSASYNPVHPRDVLEFYRDLVATAGWRIETAGALKGGRKVWALARTGTGIRIMGNDVLGGYLLLATSCDGSLATTAQFTTVRVVCNNTLTIAVNDTGALAVRVPHSRVFDADSVREQLGLAGTAFEAFGDKAEALAKRKVTRKEAVSFFTDLFMKDEEVMTEEQLVQEEGLKRTVTKLLEVYEGGKGQDLRSTSGTAWGLVNAVTRYYDHERNARSRDNRLDSAWFGQGAKVKGQAFSAALTLAA